MDILSFSSPEHDAALTFVNSTTVNGVLLKNGRAWDVVASDGLLKVIGKLYKFGCGRSVENLEEGIGGSVV